MLITLLNHPLESKINKYIVGKKKYPINFDFDMKLLQKK